MGTKKTEYHVEYRDTAYRHNYSRGVGFKNKDTALKLAKEAAKKLRPRTHPLVSTTMNVRVVKVTREIIKVFKGNPEVENGD